MAEPAHNIKRRVEQVRSILLKQWDPIGVADETAAQDEYDMYAPAIVQLLADRVSSEALVTYLLRVERERMGLRGNPVVAEKTAKALLSLPK